MSEGLWTQGTPPTADDLANALEAMTNLVTAYSKGTGAVFDHFVERSRAMVDAHREAAVADG